MSTRRFLLGAAGALSGLAGCASTPREPLGDRRTYCHRTARLRRTVCTPEPLPSARTEAEAKQLEPTPGALTLFIVRSALIDSPKVIDVTLNDATTVGTLPHALIRARVQPGQHVLSFEWEGRLHRQPVSGRAGEVRFVELAGSSTPFDRSYHWSDADPAGARLRGREAHLIAGV